MEECPGPVLSFCRQPESEQEQFACGSSRGEQQFGSVWFHGWKHLQVRNPLFPCLSCVRPCIAPYVIRMPVAKLGLAPPCLLWDPAFVSWARPCLLWSPAILWDPLWDLALLRGPGFCEALLSVRHSGFCEALPSVRPFLLWDLAFCETLHSVRPCLLWGPAFCEARPPVRVKPQFSMWHLMFCETMPLFQMWNHALCESLLWVTHLAFCETLPSETLPSVRLWLLWGLASLASVRLCLLWDPSFCETLTWLIVWDVR